MRTLLFTIPLALLAFAGAAAAGTAEMEAGHLVSVEADRVIVTIEGSDTAYLLTDGAAVAENLENGDLVLVRVIDRETMTADRVVVVDTEVEVLEDVGAERAVFGTVQATGPQQLIVETTSGEQAFVVQPEKLFPPLPTPDQRVAVTYRTLEVHPPRHLATGLVVLEEGLAPRSAVRVTSEPVAVVAEAQPTPPPARRPVIPAPAPAPEPLEVERVEQPELPQTGSNLPALGLIGLSLLALGSAVRWGS